MSSIFSKFIVPVIVAGSFLFTVQPVELSARGGERAGGGESGGERREGSQYHGEGQYNRSGQYHGEGEHEGEKYEHHDNNYYHGEGWGGGVYVAPVSQPAQPVYYNQSEWNTETSTPPPYEPGENY